MTDKFQWTRGAISKYTIVSVFETVCASSLAICAYQIGEHLHLTLAGHLDL
jgi:hypothetical protein